MRPRSLWRRLTSIAKPGRGGYALYFPDGGVRNRNTWPVIKETVGPGQTLEDTFDICQFVDFPPEYLIYYDTLTTERVYKVTCSQK